MTQDLLIIGIDGGATKVSGWTVERKDDGTFELGDLNVQKNTVNTNIMIRNSSRWISKFSLKRWRMVFI